MARPDFLADLPSTSPPPHTIAPSLYHTRPRISFSLSLSLSSFLLFLRVFFSLFLSLSVSRSLAHSFFLFLCPSPTGFIFYHGLFIAVYDTDCLRHFALFSWTHTSVHPCLSTHITLSIIITVLLGNLRLRQHHPPTPSTPLNPC